MSAVAPAIAMTEGPLAVDDLKDLMRAVTETTTRLEATHRQLRDEVARLQGELADANAQLRRSRDLAALGEMAAGIAHEIRNPLGSIRLYNQMLAEDLDGVGLGPNGVAAPHVELCEKIGRAVSGMDAIVRDVLLFAREIRLQTAPCDVPEVVQRAVESCDGLLAAHGVAVVVECSDEHVIEADASLLGQALSNLIRNAVEAMHDVDGPRIEIASRGERIRTVEGKHARHVVISVHDRGPGIAPEVEARMFNPFFTTRATGTGLGLAIVHRILDAHGGRVRVRRPGDGAHIELCLPLGGPGSHGSRPSARGVNVHNEETE